MTTPVRLMIALLGAALAGTSSAAAQTPPLRVLMLTGGGYHDYNNQKNILTQGIATRANVTFTIDDEAGTSNNAAKLARHADPNWTRDFDVVLYNICFADQKEADYVNGIIKAHVTHKTPAVVIHCTIHSYNYRGDNPIWSMFLGVRSQRHQRQMAYTVEALAPTHPILAKFTAPWNTPQGELYEILEVFPTATPLTHAFGQESQKHQVTAWTNNYEGVRVFGTTMGHHNVTMQTENYLNLITAGILWAAGKLDEKGHPLPGYGK